MSPSSTPASPTNRDDASRSDDDDSVDDNNPCSSSDDGDMPVHGPKGALLGWNSEPVPYQLFKPCGLDHFFEGEIRVDASYRGRRNFKKHFAETRCAVSAFPILPRCHGH